MSSGHASCLFVYVNKYDAWPDDIYLTQLFIIMTSLARAVMCTAKFDSISPVLAPLH